jgi:MFS family permease
VADANRVAVRAIVFAQFAPAFLFSGVAVALPAMGHELAMSAVELGLVETTFLAAGTAFLLPAGRLADATGRRTLYRVSLLVFTACSFAVGCVTNGTAVLVLRFVQGVASAVFSAAGPAVLVELVPVERRGRVFGAMIGVAYAGLALGPTVAGACVDWFGWRSVFFFGAAWILLGAVPVWRALAPRWVAPGRWTDPGSVIALTVAAGAWVFAPALPGALAAGAVAVGSIAALAFLGLQLRVAAPLLDLRELRRNTPLRSALLVQMLLYLNAFCVVFLSSLYLQFACALSPVHAGMVLATSAVVMASVAPFAGRLADRARPQRVALAGVVAVVASSLLGLGLGADSGIGMVVGVLALQGLGFGLFSSPNLAVVMASMPPARGGVASALAGQSRGLGMFAGMAITGAIVAAHYGQQAIQSEPARVAAVMHTAFTVLVGSSGLALLAALRAGAFRRTATPTARA